MPEAQQQTTSLNITEPIVNEADTNETLIKNQIAAPAQIKDDKPTRSYTFLSNSIFGFIIRTFQLIFAILVMGLAGESLNNYETTSAMIFMMFTAVLTIVYFLIITLISFVSGVVFIVGINLFWELILTIFWFAAFISVAAIYGDDDCNNTYASSYWGYVIHINGDACHSAKAAIAFGALNFALFLSSLIILLFTSFTTFTSSNHYYQTIGKNQIVLNRPLVAVTGMGSTIQSNDLEQNTVTSSPEFKDSKN